MKPLGHKAYGSIPHLPGSRLGPGDHHCSPGQAVIACEKARDRHDVIIVQEKLDGSNVSVAKIGGKCIALTRAGYTAESSPHLQHHIFAKWVTLNYDRFDAVLKEGERICGEWLAMAHGTRYELPHEPFVVFDLMVGHIRVLYSDFLQIVKPGVFITPRLLHMGGPFSIEKAINKLSTSGHGAIDPVEGAIWRVERKGAVDFLVKYVRHDKEDGKYFEEKTGIPVWNIKI